MSPLCCLVYVSSAVREVTPADLDHLLVRARARNQRCLVTGVLLYAAGDFMQYLEGPDEGVAEVYRYVRTDPLHTGIIELLGEPIGQREFAEWAMAYRVLDAEHHAEPWLQRPGVAERITGPYVAASPARTLLRSFWNRVPVRF